MAELLVSILLHFDEQGVRALYDQFFLSCPAGFFAVDEAESFARYLGDLELEIPHLRSVLEFELALLRAYGQGTSTEVEFEGDPEQILADLGRGVRPAPPSPPTRAVTVAAG